MLEPPAILYHYCSNRTLVEILRNKEIWLSDPRFMNDAKEFKHAVEILACTFRHISEGYREQFADIQYQGMDFDKLMKHLERQIETIGVVPWNEARSPFVFCMSEDGDSLSQWRAYGKGEFCIGFDSKELMDRTNESIVPVTYRELKPDMDVDVVKGINSILETYLNGAREGGLDPELASNADQYFGKLRNTHYYLRAKHVGFREEREWRLVSIVEANFDPETVFFDGSGRYPIPRFKMSIANKYGNLGQVIKEVVVGPGWDEERARAAFEMLSLKGGLSVEPKFSKTPYRPHKS